MKNIITVLLLAFTLLSCDNDSDIDGQGTSNLDLIFNNTVGNEDVVLSNEQYLNASGETFVINELKYIISNITLHEENGNTYAIPVDESYFVIDESGSVSAGLRDIPEGLYTSLTFGFGIDPTKYPIASGTLNFVPTAEEAGMLWTWSAGYKFLKFEGDYDTTPEMLDSKPFNFHVGSHGATLDNYREVNLSMSKELSADNIEILTINFDVSKIFDSIHTISLVDKDDIQVDPINAPKIADNVSSGFRIDQ